MTNPLVSVCLITHNHAPFIGEALASILSQECEFDLEVVVADDCSTDGTREVIQQAAARHPQVVPVLRDRRVGASENFRLALGAVRGELIAYLEGDDYFVSRRKLTAQATHLLQHPGTAGCFHDVRVVDAGGATLSAHFPLKLRRSGVTQADLLRVGNNSHSSSRVFRRACVLNLPPWFQTHASDAGLEVLVAGFGSWDYLGDVMSAYRVHGAGSFIGASSRDRSQFLLKAYRHMWQDDDLCTRHGELLSDRARHYSLEIARACLESGDLYGYVKYLALFVRFSRKKSSAMKFILWQEILRQRDPGPNSQHDLW